jgi:hypothetical protein
MSYSSCSGVGSAYSSNYQFGVSTGKTIPEPPNTLVSGTQYTAFNFPTQNNTSGSNGRGTYIIAYTFDIQGDNTTAFSQVYLQFLLNGGRLWDNEVLVGTTLPDANSHSFYIPFIWLNNLETPPYSVSVTLNATFEGTAPQITSSYATIYKIS